jgi:DNA-binding NtrC family response regulator
VSSGLLREDLFYRLRVVPIKLPPLRQRLGDVALLANHFLSFYWERHRGTRTPPPPLTEATLEALRSRTWRGNVRELQNVIEHLAVLAQPGQPICPEDIPFYEQTPKESVEKAIPSALLDEGYYAAREKLVSNFEKAYLWRVVDKAGGNMSKAARMANIDRTTLYRLIERYNFTRDEFADVPSPAAP